MIAPGVLDEYRGRNTPGKKYDIVYCDPPWDYKGSTQYKQDTITSGAISHYPTVKLSNLKEMTIPNICATNCLLFMWTSSPHLDQAIELMKAWGFRYITIAFVWDKHITNPSHYTMSQIEICILGKRGKIPTPRGARNVKQFLSERRTAHSAKPNEIRERIHKMFPTQHKVELFARTKHEFFDVFGNEIEGSITL